MGKHTEPKSDFIYQDSPVPTTNVVLVVHVPDPNTLDVWMPRHISDCFTPAMRDSLIAAITDFVRNVPIRKA